jgi:vacuolar-type H+-ATPase subunit I/STV1
MSSDTYFNASEAAKQTGKSVVTIRHYLASGKFPNATQTAKGKVQVWRIPLTDLVSAGLLDKVSNPAQALSSQEQRELKETALVSELDRLETELRHTRELLAIRLTELESYRQREAQLFSALETKQTQEQRRFRWFRRNPATP